MFIIYLVSAFVMGTAYMGNEDIKAKRNGSGAEVCEYSSRMTAENHLLFPDISKTNCRP